MRIFLTGATGYIGFAVATALRRAGHEVLGLVRQQSKMRRLRAMEIEPVPGTLQEPERYRAAAESCSVLVHAAADYQADTPELDRKTVEFLLGLGATGPQPKTLVYTSGVWIYGDTGGSMADETTPVNPPAAAAHRPAVEQMVLTARATRGVVIRPGDVYGGRGGLTGMWFTGATEGTLRVVGDGRNRWPMVHVEDLADAYVRMIESSIRGEIFNVTDRSRWSVGEMAAAAARAAGYDGAIEFVPVREAAKQFGSMADCLAMDQHVDARKTVRLLGWQPKHGGFVDGVERYYEAWKAGEEG